MNAVFRHTLKRLMNQVWGWGLSFAVLGWFIVATYNALLDQMSQILSLVKGYPPALMSFFGDISKMTTPGGYLDTGLLSYGVVVLGIFAIMVGSGLLVGDEEAGRLDLVQACPISRSALFAGSFIGLAAATAAILALTWAGCAIGLIGSKLAVTLGTLALPFVATFAVMLLFAGLSLWLSMVLPSRSLAATTAGTLLVASYFVTSLARVITSLEGINKISPLAYFQGGLAVDGLNWGWLFGLLIATAVLIGLSWWGYQRRDLRVSGEGSWNIPGMKMGKTTGK